MLHEPFNGSVVISAHRNGIDTGVYMRQQARRNLGVSRINTQITCALVDADHI